MNDRLEAERQIASLKTEAVILKQTIKDLEGSHEIVGQSAAIRGVLAEVHQVADTDATVLITGETGTGKELIARAIHDSGPRRAKPLVIVNCGAIPASLVESEFFGHEKGAFTGATDRRPGRFALADTGTIVLDEVGELPLDTQVKLLRVLQQGEFEPVGSSRTKKVDVRVIAATNRNLAREVEQGRFRQDLYYRLSVFPLHVLPLRERRDDIPLLATAFTARLARRLRRRIDPPSDAEVSRLAAYDWPGNIRELQNVLERAVITSVDGRLNLERALPALSADASTHQHTLGHSTSEDESLPPIPDGPLRDGVTALRSLKDQLQTVRDAGSIDTFALRLGFLYRSTRSIHDAAHHAGTASPPVCAATSIGRVRTHHRCGGRHRGRHRTTVTGAGLQRCRRRATRAERPSGVRGA